MREDICKLTLKLPLSLRDRIELVAIRRGEASAVVIREAIRLYLECEEERIRQEEAKRR